MWTWLRAHAVSIYGTYWHLRGLREYEFIFKSKPFAGLEPDATLQQRVHEVIERYMRKTNTHWGQGKLNPSTVAWLIRQAEQACRDDA